MDRASPELVDVPERLLAVVQVELLAVEAVAQVQLAGAVVVAVLDHDVGLAEVGHAVDDRVADLPPVLLDDHPLVALAAVEVQVELVDQVLGQVVAQERDVVLQLADLEDLLAALALGAASRRVLRAVSRSSSVRCRSSAARCPRRS